MFRIKPTFTQYKRFSLFIVALFAFLFFFISCYIVFSHLRPIHAQSKILNPQDIEAHDYQVNIKVWKQKILQLGENLAYQKLKQQYVTQGYQKSHQMAHIFGEALYLAKGLPGFTVCDETFSYGCYHGFFTSAVSSEGEGVINKLNALCLAKFGAPATPCQHGIGHGLYEYFGSEKINQALEKCHAIQTKLLLGCSSGVFMEYNFPIAESLVLIPRKLDSNVYAPCNVITNDFKESCYYELPSLWIANKIPFTTIVQLCDQIEGKYQDYCRKGSGLAASKLANYDKEIALSLCKEYAFESETDICLAGIYWGALNQV